MQNDFGARKMVAAAMSSKEMPILEVSDWLEVVPLKMSNVPAFRRFNMCLWNALC
jgi:hypothetical protein